MNVLGGTRYGMVTEETRNYVKGLYGRPPAPIKPAVAKLILGGEKRIRSSRWRVKRNVSERVRDSNPARKRSQSTVRRVDGMSCSFVQARNVFA